MKQNLKQCFTEGICNFDTESGLGFGSSYRKLFSDELVSMNLLLLSCSLKGVVLWLDEWQS